MTEQRLCEYDRAWTTVCKKPVKAKKGPPICTNHRHNKCWCGKQAVRECCHTGQLVCGFPLCAEHECKLRGLHGPHSEKGRKQYDDALSKAEKPIESPPPAPITIHCPRCDTPIRLEVKP